MSRSISVVTPTLNRPNEVRDLLANLSGQTVLPRELVLVDGAPESNVATEDVVAAASQGLPFACRYVRSERGTAIQRNAGIDAAAGSFVAFVDDDVRLEPDFFERILEVFGADGDGRVGGVVGYRTNQHFRPESRARWRWYRRLRLLETYEPGRYDYKSGYPINANLQAPFSGTKRVDFMTTACAVWRREVFAAGLRFDPYFRNYGILEDAHLSLRASRSWQLLQCGDARCRELHSPNSREAQDVIGYKQVANYYYVFRDVAGPLRWDQKARFWRFQSFELLRFAASGIRYRRPGDLKNLRGRAKGMVAVLSGRYLRPDA